MKFSNRGRQAAFPYDCVLAGLRVLSAVDNLDRRMLALDGESAEVVHAVVTEFEAGDAAFNGDGLIRAMRPGGDAPLERPTGTA